MYFLFSIMLVHPQKSMQLLAALGISNNSTTRASRYKNCIQSGPCLSARINFPPIVGICKRNFASLQFSKASPIISGGPRTAFQVSKLFTLIREVSRNNNTLIVFYEHPKRRWVNVTSQYGCLTLPSNLTATGRELRYLLGKASALGFTSPSSGGVLTRLQSPIGLIVYIADGPD